jgi:hypothetical protein
MLDECVIFDHVVTISTKLWESLRATVHKC